MGAAPSLLLWGDYSYVQTVTSIFEPLAFLKLPFVRVLSTEVLCEGLSD
jgi:hypothetical protein